MIHTHCLDLYQSMSPFQARPRHAKLEKNQTLCLFCFFKEKEQETDGIRNFLVRIKVDVNIASGVFFPKPQ